MTVDTKGLVHTPIKDVMHVMHIIQNTIVRLMRDAGFRPLPLRLAKGFSSPTIRLVPGSDTAQVFFQFSGEDARMMSVFFDCDCDNAKEFPGAKIKLSLGAHGNSVKYMRAVLQNLTHLGRCYIDECDGSNKGYEEVVSAPLTLASAVARGLDSPFGFRHWPNLHHTLGSAQPLHEFLGITAEELSKCHGEDASFYAVFDVYRERADVPQENGASGVN